MPKHPVESCRWAMEEGVNMVGPDLLACNTRYVFTKEEELGCFNLRFKVPLKASFALHRGVLGGAVIVGAELVYL